MSSYNRFSSKELTIAGKEQTVETRLKEAEDQLLRKDYLAAMVSLESAWHLKPNDPAIVHMQQRIQLAQQKESTEKHEAKLNEAQALFSQGQDEQAFFIASEILAEDPSQKTAKALRDQILDSRWEQVQKQMNQELELAFQPLAFCDFEVTLSLLGNLQKTLEIESCRKEIERLRLSLASLESAFQTEQYYDVPHIVKTLLSRDPFGWLETHHAVFAGIQTIAQERVSLRKKIVGEALQECRNLLSLGQTGEAIAKIEDLLKRGPVPEAEDLRHEILNHYRQTKIQEAQAYAGQLDWEHAIACWQEILHYFPDAGEIEQSISEAHEHVQKELLLQQELLRQLKSCYSLILKEHWGEAQELVEGMLRSIQPGFRLIETEKQIETLQAEIRLHNQEQKKQVDAHLRDLSLVRKLYKRGLFPEALEKISLILETEYVQEEAVELKIAIEKAIRTQAVTARFQSAVQKGKEYYDQRNWQKAIEFWRKANSLSEESYVRDWIEQAEQLLKKERQARLSIIAMLAEAEELIFYDKFVEAAKRLDKCRKALSEKFPMQDLAEQVQTTAVRLEEAIRKEEALRASIQSELEEAALLYQEKLYRQALLKVEAILQQQPEMESAIKLKSQIEADEGEDRRILEMIRAAIKLVVKRDFKQLPGLLSRLKEVSGLTPYAEDCKSITDELPLLVLEIESGDRITAHNRLDRLFCRSLLLLEYQQTLRNFIDSLELKNQKEQELEKALAAGLDSLERGNREGALECLERFQEIFGDKLPKRRYQSADGLDRTATLTEDDLKLTDLEVQKLQYSLLHHEVETILAAARASFIRGDESRAKELFLQALQLDPDNATARDALHKLQKPD